MNKTNYRLGVKKAIFKKLGKYKKDGMRMKIQTNRFKDIDYEQLVKIIGKEELKLYIENYISEQDLWDLSTEDNTYHEHTEIKTIKQLFTEDNIEFIYYPMLEDYRIELMMYVATELSVGNEEWYFYFDEVLDEEIFEQVIVTCINNDNLVALIKDGIDNGLIVDFKKLEDELLPYQLTKLMS